MSTMPRLLIGGIGISPALHLTPQLLTRVADCTAIYVAAVTRAQLEEAATGHAALVRALRDPAHTFFLHEAYAHDVDPRSNYANAVVRIADHVECGAAVAFLPMEHPQYWVSVTRGLIERLGPQRVEGVPSVSSFDTFVTDTHTGIEPFFPVLDASFAISQGLALDRRSSYLFDGCASHCTITLEGGPYCTVRGVLRH